ncbi:hypothetical protein [Mycobacterium talmoniae]|uniref:Mce protein n=1 Tax=Mycobacterium talmoniae TaxID=1858794 RepID=A0A1S1NH24_9MYCO|nr:MULTISPECIES: hypothetical protein [Mycobacterium]OHV05073.1 hypothetical protein BKN37_07235 [Mycobacterium talmoniae]PQM45436.1 hypothetical protein C1Y40_04399 [Mycobacterium talmoniae]TDH56157.1 hypothetical protein E2F47_07775 [Mycobacterium eburneum]
MKTASDTAPADNDDVVEEVSDNAVGVTEVSVVDIDTDEDPTDPETASHKTRWWRRALPRRGAPGSRRWIRAATRGTVVVVFVAALAGAGYEGWLLFQQHRKQAAAYQALDAAQQFATNFTNADPNTIDQAISAITEGTTGEFKDRYVRSISQLRAMLIENKVTTRGTVVRSAIESATSNRVQVLLFVKESFTSAAVPEAPPGPPAQPPGAPPGPLGSPAPPGSPAETPTEVVGMEVTVEKVDGRWLVSKVVPGDKL